VNLIEHCPLASEAYGEDVYLYREDLYWREKLEPAVWVGISARHPGLVPELGGSKIRMFDQFDFGKYQAVATTGITQSNQVRQLAAYMASKDMTMPLYVVVMPDGATVDTRAEMERDNLRVALALYSNLHLYVMPNDSVENRTYLQEWETVHRSDPDSLFIPRGVSCPEGIVATTQIGEDISNNIIAGMLPEGLEVLVISGSGGTHIGISRGMLPVCERSIVIGLPTRFDAETQMSKLVARSPDNMEIFIEDRWQVPVLGGSTPASNASVDKWTPLLGVEVDRQYCGRMCQYLDAGINRETGSLLFRTVRDGFIRQNSFSYTGGLNPVLLVVSGLEQTKFGELS
jgi:1-aminocyclopropane-1-carboxylate deaminase/D-cysteine desulfhydrase-like pyridoxal-dependent ACC family enzyme